jgi:hypothetical protein
MKRLEASWKALCLICAILSAGVVGGTWAYDIQGQVAANTTERQLQTYDRLLRKYRAQGHLDIRDQIAFCNAARFLRIGGPEVRRICG